MTKMRIYTDSSFDEKRNIAGIGLYIQKGAKNITISHWIPADNNNYGELWAIYQASILGFGRDCVIYTDSQNAIAYIENKIKDKPRTQVQYIRHQQMRVLAYKIRKLKPKVQWLQGHVHHFQELPIGNQMADMLAKQGRSKYYGK